MAVTDDLIDSPVAINPGPFVVSHPCPACHGQGSIDEQLKAMKDGVEEARRRGIEPIDD